MATKTNNKKMYVTGGIILGVAGLAFLFRKEIKNLFVRPLMPGENGGGIWRGGIDPNNELPPVDPGTLVVDPGTVADIVTPVVVEDPNKIDIDKKIKKGQKDANVKLLQYNIREIQNINGIQPLLDADGDFGNKTDKALLVISDFYKKNGYWTIRKARETMVRYAGQKGKLFPAYLAKASNIADLKKIFSATVVKKVVEGTIR